jgi:hypothetical protein
MIVDYSAIKVAGIYRQLPKLDIVPLIKEAQKQKVLVSLFRAYSVGP